MERKGGRIERVKGYKYIEMEEWRGTTYNNETVSIVMMFVRHCGQ